MSVARQHARSEVKAEASPKKAASGRRDTTAAPANPLWSVLATHVPPVVQAKLEVGAPDDEYERQADRVADQVMRMPAGGPPGPPPEDEEDLIQGQATPSIGLLRRQPRQGQFCRAGHRIPDRIAARARRTAGRGDSHRFRGTLRPRLQPGPGPHRTRRRSTDARPARPRFHQQRGYLLRARPLRTAHRPRPTPPRSRVDPHHPATRCRASPTGVGGRGAEDESGGKR